MIQDLDLPSQRLTESVVTCAVQCTIGNSAMPHNGPKLQPFGDLGDADLQGLAKVTPSRVVGLIRRIKPRYEQVQPSSPE